MSITQEEFRKRTHEIIQDKIFFSNISSNPVEVVKESKIDNLFMSVEGDLFRVTVKGSRESIVRMMNMFSAFLWQKAEHTLFCDDLQFCKIYFINL